MGIRLTCETWKVGGWRIRTTSHCFGSQLNTGKIYAHCLSLKRFGDSQQSWTSLDSGTATCGQSVLTKSGWKNSRKRKKRWGACLGSSARCRIHERTKLTCICYQNVFNHLYHNVGNVIVIEQCAHHACCVALSWSIISNHDCDTVSHTHLTHTPDSHNLRH